MSADNYTTCPACAKTAEIERRTAESQLNALYGTIPPEDYLKAYNEVHKRRNVLDRKSLGEYYTIGIIDGVFNIHYKALCTTCGYKFTYEYSCYVENI